MKKSLALGGVGWFANGRPDAKGLKCCGKSKEQSPELVLVGKSSSTADNPFATFGYEFWLLLLKMTYSKPAPITPVSAQCRYTDIHETQIHRVTDIQTLRDSDKHDTHDTHEASVVTCVFSVEDAIRIALPRGLDANCVFRYCRALRAFEENASRKLSKDALSEAFTLFFQKVQMLDPNAGYEHYRYIFDDLFPKVKVPLGKSVIDRAMEIADSEPLPACSDALEPRMARLLAVCWQLSNRGSKSFYLSVRDAARIYETKNKYVASAILKGLVADKRLIMVAPAVIVRRHAAEYKFP